MATFTHPQPTIPSARIEQFHAPNLALAAMAGANHWSVPNNEADKSGYGISVIDKHQLTPN
jgi:hypothetical protein